MKARSSSTTTTTTATKKSRRAVAPVTDKAACPPANRIIGPTSDPARLEVEQKMNRVIAACVGGDPHLGTEIVDRLASTLAFSSDPERQSDALTSALLSIRAFGAKDGVEAMLAAQATALHVAAMECLHRAADPDLPSEMLSRLRRDGATLARGFTDVLDVLDRRRGTGAQQIVRVERVVVADGGRAFVGAVTPAVAAAVAHSPPPPLPAAITQSAPLDMPLVFDEVPDRVPAERSQGEGGRE